MKVADLFPGRAHLIEAMHDRLREAVDADRERSRRLRITGVPTFVAAGRGLVGAQPLAALRQLLAVAGATRRR